MSRRIFIVRHGNTFASSADARRIGARTDIPLVQSGLEQAALLGRWFATMAPAGRLYCSALTRARQTAQAIANATGREIDGTLDWLGEIDHGPDEGRPESEVLARLGADAIARWDEAGMAPDGWIVDAESRIAAWRGFFAEPVDGTDVLVTSNGAARFALIAAGLQAPALKLRTGAYGELIVEQGSVSLVRWDVRPD